MNFLLLVLQAGLGQIEQNNSNVADAINAATNQDEVREQAYAVLAKDNSIRTRYNGTNQEKVLAYAGALQRTQSQRVGLFKRAIARVEKKLGISAQPVQPEKPIEQAQPAAV